MHWLATSAQEYEVSSEAGGVSWRRVLFYGVHLAKYCCIDQTLPLLCAKRKFISQHKKFIERHVYKLDCHWGDKTTSFGFGSLIKLYYGIQSNRVVTTSGPQSNRLILIGHWASFAGPLQLLGFVKIFTTVFKAYYSGLVTRKFYSMGDGCLMWRFN
jgi:hypothetical protein